jgi:hypothetical protein
MEDKLAQYKVGDVKGGAQKSQGIRKTTPETRQVGGGSSYIQEVEDGGSNSIAGLKTYFDRRISSIENQVEKIILLLGDRPQSAENDLANVYKVQAN